jgi:uncharacterized protein
LPYLPYASIIYAMSRPFKVFRLQQIDSQIDWIRNRLHEIEKSLSEDAEVRQASETARQADDELQQARKAQRAAEENVRQQRTKLEQNEATLYGGRMRNPKELQDMQNEVASLKRFLVVLEDRQLEAMLAEEEKIGVYEAAAANLEKAKAVFAQQSAVLIVEQGKSGKDLARLESERQAAMSSIQAEDLDLYESLRKKRKGIAVAKVTSRACEACGATLSAALLSDSYSTDRLVQCSACGRILYTG